MYDTKVVCTKCKQVICKYDSQRPMFNKDKVVFCQYCGGKVEHKSWCPDL